MKPDGGTPVTLSTGEKIVLSSLYAVKYVAAAILVVAAADLQFGLARIGPIAHFGISLALLVYGCVSLLRLRRFGYRYARRRLPVLERVEAMAEPVHGSLLRLFRRAIGIMTFRILFALAALVYFVTALLALNPGLLTGASQPSLGAALIIVLDYTLPIARNWLPIPSETALNTQTAWALAVKGVIWTVCVLVIAGVIKEWAMLTFNTAAARWQGDEQAKRLSKEELEAYAKAAEVSRAANVDNMPHRPGRDRPFRPFAR